MFCLFTAQGGSKLERTRDLFEQALEKCPQKFCKPLFLMYAQLEEEHGLAKRAMNIYDRAATAVQDADKFDASIPAIFRMTRRNADTRITYLDVHNLHRQSYRQLWSSCYATHLSTRHRSPSGQADCRNVSAFRSHGEKVGRNRSGSSHLCACIAVLRPANLPRVLERMELIRKYVPC